MSESFKINMYFEEKGEEIESIIEHLLIDKIEKNNSQFLITTVPKNKL